MVRSAGLADCFGRSNDRQHPAFVDHGLTVFVPVGVGPTGCSLVVVDHSIANGVTWAFGNCGEFGSAVERDIAPGSRLGYMDHDPAVTPHVCCLSSTVGKRNPESSVHHGVGDIGGLSPTIAPKRYQDRICAVRSPGESRFEFHHSVVADMEPVPATTVGSTVTESTEAQVHHPGTPRGCERVAYVVGFQDQATYSDVYGGGGATVGLDCHLVRPTATPSDTLIVFMHPIGGGMYLPIVRALAAAGHHVLWANSRYRGADYALIMEKVACDLGQAVCDAKERLGYRKIVLAGWSGGGSLAMWYQALAEAGVGLADTAAGDPYPVSAERMPPADAVVLLAAHVSRHQILTEWIDPSVTDETRPGERDPALNLYNPANPNRPPYSDDFLAAFRAAQVERNRRITRWAKERLEEIRQSPTPNAELAFTVHATMADPRWLDPTVDPSDRAPGTCYLGDPNVVNDGPVGLARFSTLRSWISQWSYDDARCDAEVAGAAVSVPALVIGNSADDACTPSHTHRLYKAVRHDHKQLRIVRGATHYYTGPDGKAHLAEATDAVGDFIAAHLGA